MARLSADFSTAFSRDLKKKAQKRQWTFQAQGGHRTGDRELPASIAVLKQRHNMHTLAGKWQGRNECHVANAGDGPVIWSCNGKVAFFEHTGSHDELFGT